MRFAVIFAIWVLWLMGSAGLIDFSVCAGPLSYCAKEARK